MKRLILRFILILLLIFFVIFEVFIAYKKYNNIRQLEKTKFVASELDLSFPYKAEYKTGFRKNNQKEFKILVLGNSISSGIDVDNINDDYVNVLIRKISSRQNNCYVEAKVYNLSNFEKHYANYDYDMLKPLKDYEPNILIFQLGENYQYGDNDLYKSQYIKLINFFGNDNIKIVTSPYWGEYYKNKLQEQVALETNSFFVDISNLFAYGKKTRADYEKKYDEDAPGGLGLHPGKYGMKRIAEQIFVLVNALLANNLI